MGKYNSREIIQNLDKSKVKKVKVFLCLTTYHAMKRMEEWKYSSTHS